MISREGQSEAKLLREASFVNAADTTTVVPLPGIQTGPYFNRDYVKSLLKGGFHVVHLNNLFWLYDDFYNAVRRLSHFYTLLSNELRDQVRLVRQCSDVARAREEGKLAVLVHSQNAMILDNDIRLLPVLRQLGVTSIQLTHQGRTLLGDGRGEKRAHGLSVFGEYAIREMNRLGIILDLAHASRETVLEAVEVTQKPPIVSHATLDSVFSHPRNLTDEEVEAVASKGGVIGVMGIPGHLVKEGYHQGAGVKDVVDHVDRLVETAGIDHVGIGLELGHGRNMKDLQLNFLAAQSQFGGPYTPISGLFPEWDDYERGAVARGLEKPGEAKANLISELLRRDYSVDEVCKILGENFLRIYEEVLTPPPFLA